MIPCCSLQTDGVCPSGCRARARCAAAFALCLAAGTAAAAEPAFPQRPVRWIVPFPAAGSIDLVGRVIGPKIYDSWGQQIVIDNRAGGGGRLGAELAAAAPADGYTQLFTLNTTYTIDRSLFKHLSYDPDKAFVPISLVAATSQLLVINPSLPVKNVQELIAYCKARPGQVNYGSSGTGGSLHLAMEYFKSVTGIEIVHVPYKGGPPAATDLIAGQISMLFFNTPAATPYVKTGKIRALGVSTAQRSPLLPDVPTIAESGVKGFDVSVWFGLSAPTGTPPAIIKKTQAEIVKALAIPEVRKQLSDLGAEPVGSTPAELAARIKSESATWAKVIQASKMSFD